MFVFLVDVLLSPEAGGHEEGRNHNPRNPQPAMGEPFGTAGCAFDLALLNVVPEARCHQDCTGCFGVFS